MTNKTNFQKEQMQKAGLDKPVFNKKNDHTRAAPSIKKHASTEVFSFKFFHYEEKF